LILTAPVLRALAGSALWIAVALGPIRSVGARDFAGIVGAGGVSAASAGAPEQGLERAPVAAPTATPAGSPDEKPLEVAPPFRLPFGGAPGPSNWLLIQAYGNTTFAYRERVRIYDSGQGLHFGIDLGARCGTPVLAIGDGVVVRVDDIYHGAGPHNVVIDHPNGYASLYGHLFARSPLEVGQSVLAGEQVGLSGDPDLTCSSRPHLHLEIRNAPSHRRAYNPMHLIAADWDRIALAGAEPLGFEQDLARPSQWITWGDQPEVIFGQPLLNEYESAWPPDW
jgi:murein DD-endopeptidase MepM/ murein hydrolase activator NlpD